jgi:hypothetical protein
VQFEGRRMSNFLMVASDLSPFDSKPIKAPAIFELMMSHECWELSERSPHRGEMKAGDTFVFYLGGNQGRYIAGEAKLAGDLQPITASSPVTFDRRQVPFFTIRVPLCEIRRYPAKRLGMETVSSLSFVKNSTVERKYIGLLLRSGVRKLTDQDLELIRGQANSAASAEGDQAIG